MNIEEKKKKLLSSDYSFRDSEGNKITPPKEGSLGILATGYKGIMSWKKVKAKPDE